MIPILINSWWNWVAKEVNRQDSAEHKYYFEIFMKYFAINNIDL